MGKMTFEDPQERRGGHKTEPLFTATLCLKTLQQPSDLFLEFPPFLFTLLFFLSLSFPIFIEVPKAFFFSCPPPSEKAKISAIL